MSFQPVVRIYDIPDNTFETDEEDDSDETDTDDEDDDGNVLLLIKDTFCCGSPKSAYAITSFPPTGYLPAMVIT